MENQPQRKQLRLKNYDYARAGYYFVTICAKDRKNILSDIYSDVVQNDGNTVWAADHSRPPADLHLTRTGLMVLQYLQNIEKVYANLKLDCFVIMPNHIHFIIVLQEGLPSGNFRQSRAAVGGRPYERNIMHGDAHDAVQNSGNAVGAAAHSRPPVMQITIPKLINSLKTITSKKYGQPLWQRNYYEHVIRDEDELNSIRQYIMDNPANWQDDKYYTI